MSSAAGADSDLALAADCREVFHFRKSRLIHTALEHRGRFHSEDADNSSSYFVREVSQKPNRRAKKSRAVVVKSITLSTPSFVARSRTASVNREPIPHL